ncbi:hypothetical protein GCM10017566_14620 [Amycolatopsis bartoniae]|uniref:Uncharacterized protein n=1 Tax=Amycolatopsis bartoniae TaxID=941986 RepID=A0A8H9M9M3_9PSEU|nr:hypothetical protein GCM10017566_14620 [Amycolatopsis bartoniae]
MPAATASTISAAAASQAMRARRGRRSRSPMTPATSPNTQAGRIAAALTKPSSPGLAAKTVTPTAPIAVVVNVEPKVELTSADQ